MSGKIHPTLLALSLTLSPIAAPANPPITEKGQPRSSSPKAACRRMANLLAPSPKLESDYIHPAEAKLIDAPMPTDESPDHVVAIYGNILYPEDRELAQKTKLIHWMESDLQAPFPLTLEELNDISLYRLERFPFSELILKQLAESERKGIKEEDVLLWAQEVIEKIPPLEGRYEVLKTGLTQCLEKTKKEILENPNKISMPFDEKKEDLIQPPFTWEMRRDVFKQVVEKVTAKSPNAPYFLALQEVTPQALYDLKDTLKDKDLQWISFNNLTDKPTLNPRKEEVLGEATGFTSTLALSRDLVVLKVELGDLPTESGSVRKILGVRVLNRGTNETFNIFTTHTDHKIQNEIYARTAGKIHSFATQFFQDAPDYDRYLVGGDLNVFEQLGGGKYVERLRELFTMSKDFRETNYYSPAPIAWTTFLGRSPGPFSPNIAEDETVDPNCLDQLIVGGGINLQSSAKEGAIYNDEGKLLDYYENREEYIASLQKRIAFSDHLFNIVRFK